MKTVLLLILVMTGPMTFAGVTNGGGGKAVVCRDKDKNILKAQTLDLFEAELQYSLSFKNALNDFDHELARVNARLQAALSHNRADTELNRLSLESTFGHFKILPEGVGIKPIDDSLVILVPENCEIEQLAFFKETNVILVNGDIWKNLDTKNKVALIVHEAVYQMQRRYGAKDSRESRKITGFLLSDSDLPRVANSIPEDGDIIGCEAEDRSSLFYLFEEAGSADRQDMVTFVKLGGQPVYSEVILRISSIGKLISGEIPMNGIRASVGGFLQSKITNRVYDRGAVIAEPTDSPNDFVQASLDLISMDGNFATGGDLKKLRCFRETRNGTSVRRTSLR